MAVTTNSAQAQAYFNQGLNLLHGFWYFEAWRAFSEAVRQDSNCAMAHWGVYQSLRGNNSNPAAKKRAMARAKALLSTASTRERYYIRAYAQLDSLGRRGHVGFLTEMRMLEQLYPAEIEARLFQVRFVMHWLGFYSKPRTGYPDRREILRDLLRTHPRHSAVHHYWIHAIEFGDQPEEALESAAVVADLAPGVAHIVHMPGHIYYRTGDYDKARTYFLKAAAVDSAYMVDQGIPVTRTWNYVHNLNYLLANYGEDGRYEEGMDWARRLQRIPLDRRRTPFFYQGRMAPVRLQLRYGRWQEAALTLEQIASNDTISGTFAEEYTRGLLDYARGMAAVQRGDAAMAAAHDEKLGELEWQYASGSETPKRDRYYSKKRLQDLLLAAQELKGNLRSLQGQAQEAVVLLEEGVDQEAKLGYAEPPRYARPVLESLGEVHLRAGNWEKARHAFAMAMKKRPRSGHALSGIARTYAMAGDREMAAAAYREFLEAWKYADEELNAVLAARKWLAENDQ